MMKANGFATISRLFCAITLLAAWLALPIGGSTAFAANSAGDESPASDGSATAGVNDEVAKDFIKSLADRAIASLTAQSVPYDERVKRFRELFNEYFAVRGIGKWVLGPHWGQASEAQREEYLSLFEDLMVISYIDRFSKYSGEVLDIKKTMAHKNDKTTTVFSELTQPNSNSKVRVDWRVTAKDEKIKITDIAVEGISMGATIKSDFGAIIRQEGNNVDGLIVALRGKTSGLKAAKN